MITEEERDFIILETDMFEGDFGEQGDRVLSNKMVVARKEHKCSHCSGTIDKGERHRHQKGIYGDFMEHRWCGDCCDLMVLCELDDGETEIDPYNLLAQLAGKYDK